MAQITITGTLVGGANLPMSINGVAITTDGNGGFSYTDNAGIFTILIPTRESGSGSPDLKYPRTTTLWAASYGIVLNFYPDGHGQNQGF